MCSYIGRSIRSCGGQQWAMRPEEGRTGVRGLELSPQGALEIVFSAATAASSIFSKNVQFMRTLRCRTTPRIVSGNHVLWWNAQAVLVGPALPWLG